ncbi:hypothetical protein ACFV4T_08190 [Streptomyces sp. NPDC059755]|uniref:hypothetical protein n=1 Tax=Streptomyces sp. NPDC059755 TaxID=3346934 RepID=UPI0036677651
MNPTGVEELLHAVLGGPLARRSLHELSAASGGNVVYLRELVLGALSGGYLTEDGEIWHLRQGRLPGTARLAEVIGSRLADADAAGRPVLELPALCEPLALADAEVLAPPACPPAVRGRCRRTTRCAELAPPPPRLRKRSGGEAGSEATLHGHKPSRQPRWR